MHISRWFTLATVVGGLVAGSACTQQAADDAKREGGVAVDAVKEVAQNIAQTTADKTSEVLSTTGEAITDGWITTTVSTGFVGEALLKGSNIDVDTQDHVVTLKGVVGSDAAKARAVAIARGSRGVARVVDQLAVR